MRAGPMHRYLAIILQAGLRSCELAEMLAALPCIPALEQLNAVRPARGWGKYLLLRLGIWKFAVAIQ